MNVNWKYFTQYYSHNLTQRLELLLSVHLKRSEVKKVAPKADPMPTRVRQVGRLVRLVSMSIVTPDLPLLR